MSQVLVREATDQDGEALLGLLGSSWSRYDGMAFEAADHPLVERPASHFAERGGRLWLVVRDDVVVGSLGVARHPRPDEFELSLICLDDAAQGQGFAAALLAGANAFAAASGGSRISARVDTRLTDGALFLERHGFVRDPGVRQTSDGSGALEEQFSRAVDDASVSSQPSEALPAGGA